MKNNKSKNSFTRREFITAAGAFSFSLSVNRLLGKQIFKKQNLSKPPNILIIISDQLAQKAVSAYGNQYVKTRAIDSIAANGVRFSNSYTPCPLCQPARASFWTGRLPHETNVLSNKQGESIPTDMPTLGEIFSNAGYETIHFGKTHDAGALRGFINVESEKIEVKDTPAWPATNDTYCDRDTTVKIVEYLKNKHEKPFLAVADLHNPHNICKWVGFNEGIHKDIPIPDPLPNLPDNFEIDDLEHRPLPIQYLCCTHRRLRQASNWNETNYLHYLAAYYHYISLVDSEIQLILNTLNSTPACDNTLIVFFADHGDGMAAHRMTTKHISFYEETTRIPLIFSGTGIKGSDVLIDQPLVSLIDLLPTLCDYAGFKIPPGLHGQSLVPWLKGQKPEKRHEYVVSQWNNEYDEAITPGRMLRTNRFKYISYLEGNGEELYDLEKDPGEKRTLIHDTDYADILQHHHELFAKYLEQTNDPYLSLEVKVDPKLRNSHPLGYMYHNYSESKKE